MTTPPVDEAEQAAPAETGAGSAALGRYHPGLDGLRAVAMMVMLAYHSELPFARGAFLGLSQFFTLSGFLITSMLLRGHDRGGIDLKQFWQRRFQRLMPAALLCLAGIVVFGATVANREQAEELPGQVFAAATYWANWYFVITDKSYVNLFAAPSPVQHYWSLAVEEQFYLFMPVVMVLLLRRTRSARVLATVFAGGAVLSTGWMIFLYDAGAGLDRIYYGTDTRMAEMLVGALLAVVVTEIGERFTERARRTLGFVGVFAFALSAWGSATIPLADGPMWRGGMLAYSFVSCAVILGITSERGPLGAVLSWGPLPSVGRITYGLYLYHWPIFLWLTAERTGLDPWPLFAIRMGLTFGVAALSYNLIESPIRKGALDGIDGRIRVLAAPVMVVALVAGAFVATDRDAADPLATIRSDDRSLTPPLEPGDGVLDLLVIADDSDPDVVARLDELGEEDDTLSVVVADPFSCSELVEVEEGRTCANWVDTWPDLVEEHDPDLVLLYVEDWPLADLSRLAGPDADPTSVATEALDSGFDLLASQGAPILWAAPGANFAENLARAGQPLAVAMGSLEQDRTGVHHVLGSRLPIRGSLPDEEYVERAAAALIADASLYQRIERGDLTRVMILGDSQARSLGYGLERWAATSERALVWNAATEGCGLADEGIVEGSEGAQPVSERCRGAVRSWARQVEEFRPDVIVALTSVWDLLDRELPGWGGLRVPGDAEFDAYLVDEFTDAFDTWTAHGARVVWLSAPCSRFRPIPGQATQLPPGFDDERAAHLNDEILPALMAQRPDIERFELDDVLCPDGQFQDEIDGVSPVRVDGIHFSVDGSIWFAEEYGEELLRMGEG
jgi:peptidoglycan/LPS O-acetylase OafA/YrhL